MIAAALAGRDLDDDVLELLDLVQPPGHVQRELEALARGRGRHAQLAGRDLEVLLLDGADDVARVEPEGLEHLGVQPDPHAVLARAEDGHVAHARQPRDDVAQVDPGIVAQEQTVVAAVGGVEVDDLQDGGGNLLGDGPLLLHVERQLGQGGGDSVLHQYLGHVEVGAHLEGDDELVGAVARARGLHVEHVLDAVDLLLDRQRDRVGHDTGARPGVAGRDLHGGRGDLGVLRDRQPEHRDHAEDDGQDGDDVRQDGPFDEEARDHAGLR